MFRYHIKKKNPPPWPYSQPGREISFLRLLSDLCLSGTEQKKVRNLHKLRWSESAEASDLTKLVILKLSENNFLNLSVQMVP